MYVGYKVCETQSLRKIRVVYEGFGAPLQVLEELIQGTDLTQSQTEQVMETLLEDANPAVIGAFLALLRAKGETLDEVC